MTMNKTIATLFLAAALLEAAGPAQIYTGTITDSMCKMNHKMMNITPDSKCVRECVKSHSDVKYVLHDGKNSWRLSDQQTPAQFAAQRVRVTGTLYPKTGVIKVDTIAPLK
jgi:hypothetical protein